MEKIKVVFHVNGVERWPIVLGNITNLFKDIGSAEAEIVVLANGPSVAAYIDPEKVATMEQLQGKGALFLACRNSLKKMCSEGVCVSEEALPSFVKVVPAGVIELIRRQQDGFAYIKP